MRKKISHKCLILKMHKITLSIGIFYCKFYQYFKTIKRTSSYMLGLLAWCFCQTPNCGHRYVLDFFLPVLETLFLPLGCLVYPWFEGFCLVFLYLVLLCFVVVSWRTALFLKGNRGKADSGERAVVAEA